LFSCTLDHLPAITERARSSVKIYSSGTPYQRRLHNLDTLLDAIEFDRFPEPAYSLGKSLDRPDSRRWTAAARKNGKSPYIRACVDYYLFVTMQ